MLAASRYGGSVEGWVQRFKYPPAGLAALDPRPGAVLAALIREAARDAPTADAVVPVPLHPRRLRSRGFNPAVALAREVARARATPLRARALRRTRDTPSQTGLDRAARARNLAGAFAARRPVSGCILLVDDVVTTGATLAAAARALRGAGAERVVGICVARTP